MRVSVLSQSFGKFLGLRCLPRHASLLLGFHLQLYLLGHALDIRIVVLAEHQQVKSRALLDVVEPGELALDFPVESDRKPPELDRKRTRLNSSHTDISR